MKTSQLYRWMKSIDQFLRSSQWGAIKDKWRETDPWRRPYPPEVLTKLFHEETPIGLSDDFYQDVYSGAKQIIENHDRFIDPYIYPLEQDAIDEIQDSGVQQYMETACRMIESKINRLINWLEGRQSLRDLENPPSDFPEAPE